MASSGGVGGRYMAYSPSPSAPHSPYPSSLRSASSSLLDQEKFATTRASKSSQLDSLLNKAVHGSTSSDHHQQQAAAGSSSPQPVRFRGLNIKNQVLMGSQVSTTAVHGAQFQTKSSSELSWFDGLSTMAVCDHGSLFRPRISSLNRHQQQYNQTSDKSSRFDGLSTKAVHGSISGNIKPTQVGLQQHHLTSQSSRFDGLSTKAVHGSRSGNNIKPTVQLQQHHGTSQSSRFDGLSTMAVHGSKSGNIKPPMTNRLSTKAVHGSKSGNNIKPPPVRRQQHHGTSKLSLFDGLSTRAVHGSMSYSVRFASDI